MTDLIPRDAAAAVCDKHSYSNNPYVSRRMADAAAEIRAIPTIDPAAIREAALKEALQRIGTLITPTSEDRMNGHEDAYRAIEALIGEKK